MIATAAGLCLIAIAGAVVWMQAIGPAPNAGPPAGDDSPVVSRLAGYVGSSVCQKCHAEEAEKYHHSPMSRSWRRARDVSLSRLPDSNEISDPHSPYRYQTVAYEGRLIQKETLRGPSAENIREMPAAYFVGSGNHARAMVSEENGYLSQLPLAWFPREGEWRLNPGFEFKNHRFDRPIGPGCVACHGGLAEHRASTRNRYAGPISNGIGCEHCHGPGQDHVAFRERDRGADFKAPPDPIVNPGKLTSRQANDVCLQCHLQGDVVVYQPAADAFSYRPGEKLSAYRLDFLIETHRPEEFGVASHGARMMQSRCFLESGKKLTCILCHDAHQPIAAVSEATYDARCNSCHQPNSCGRPDAPSEQKLSESCVACHMPKRGTREGRHLVFTDHWIQKQPGGMKADAAPLLEPNSQVVLHQFWPEADPHQARLGSAYVKLHETMGPQQPSLERGAELLRAALRKSPEDLDAKYWLASAEVAGYQSRPAIGHLTELLKAKPDWHQARFRRAVAFNQRNLLELAITDYERVIEAAPDWLEPYPLVVRLHFLRKNPARALELLKQQLSYREDATAHVNMALARHLLGEPAGVCQKSIDAALKLDPRLVVAHTTRAWLFAQAGVSKKARESYQRALAIAPESEEAKTGLKALD